MSNTDTEEAQADEGGIAQLRESARQGQHAVKELADMKRQLLFARAGIDVDTKLGKMLFQTWDGDAGDIDALRTEAASIGIGKSAGPTAEEAARIQEDDARRNAQGAIDGATTSTTEVTTEHPTDVALKGYQANLRSGMDQDLARTDAVSQFLGAAVRGDKRAFFNQDEWNRRAAEADGANRPR